MATVFVQIDDNLESLVACPGCDAVHHKRALKTGEIAHCSRCGEIIQTCKQSTIDRSLAATLAAMVLLILALCTPFLSLSRAGIESRITVIDAIDALWQSDMRWLGLTTLALIVLIPLGRLMLIGWVLGRLRFGKKVRRSMRIAFRWSQHLEPWAMADIFMVGVLVSLVKIGTLASLSVGIAFWALLGLLGASLLINKMLCEDTIWMRLKKQP